MTLATLNKQISEPFYFVSVTLVLSGIHMCGFNVRFSQAMQCKHNPVPKNCPEDSKASSVYTGNRKVNKTHTFFTLKQGKLFHAIGFFFFSRLEPE